MPTKAALRDAFLAERSDDDLVELARRTGDDDGAFEELYRRHQHGARNVARHILRSRHDADDVVNEAFAGVIAAIGTGAGPRSNFRQYLMACVRNSCKSRRWCGRTVSTDPSVLEREGAIFEDPERLSEAGLVANAFSSLSPDWQQTLWMTAVEERPTAEVAAQLGRRPAAVAALAHRARQAFAEAYLAQHQVRATDPACARISPKLAHYVRGRSGDVDVILVERHLVDCVACSCAVEEMRDLNSSLRTLTGPAPLAGAGAAGAATLMSFMPMVTAGGWSVGALSGAAIAKVAILGALLVPAAVVAASASPGNSTSDAGSGASATAAGRSSGGASGGVGQTAEAPWSLLVDPLLADVVVDTPAPVDGTADSESGSSSSSGLVTALSHDSSPAPVSSEPQVQVDVTVPPVGNAKVDASTGGIAVAVTLPILTVAVTLAAPSPSVALPGVGVKLPPLSTPPISTPPISTPPISTPPISTPPISTPEITVTGVSVPDATVPLPPPSTAGVVVSSVVVPTTLVDSVVTGVSVPPSTVTSVTPTPVTIAGHLGGSILIPLNG